MAPADRGSDPATETTALRVAAWTALVGAVVFVVVAAVVVPWQPVAGGAPGPVPADSVFTAAEIDRAEHYARWSRVWSWSGLVVSLAVACWLGFGRRGPALAERAPGPWWVQVALVVAALALVGRLATLPSAIGKRRLALDEGLSTSSWPAWALDLVLSELVGVVVTSLALVALVGCARRWRRAWPAVAGGILAALVCAGSFVYPIVVEPLFNSFEPLPDGSLQTRVLAVAEAEGVEVDDVLVADASKRTTTLNAYVSGFGSTRRIVLYDTLVDDVPEDEAVAVVAHELAHARHDDVLGGTLLGASGAVLGVGLLGLVMGWRGGRGRLPMRRAGAVPTVLALAALATVAAAPVQNGISRRVELRADATALEATDDPQAFAALQRLLAVRALADPTPPRWSQFWFGSHPTVLERIALTTDDVQER